MQLCTLTVFEMYSDIYEEHKIFGLNREIKSRDTYKERSGCTVLCGTVFGSAHRLTDAKCSKRERRVAAFDSSFANLPR